MKVFMFRLGDGDQTLAIKSMHVTQKRRERVREHILKQGVDYVWFEDEDPPDEIMDALIHMHQQITGDTDEGAGGGTEPGGDDLGGTTPKDGDKAQ